MAQRGRELAPVALRPRDAWWTVAVVDPVAMALLPLVLRVRWLTALRLTLAALVLGLASVAAFASGALVLGAILFEVRFLLDCLDGKVARVRRTTSRWGGFVDLASDTAIVGAAYAALGSWLLREEVAGAWTVLVLLPLFATAIWIHLYRRLALGEDERTDRPAETPTRVWSLRRLRPYPGSVEVETLLLFLFPLVLPVGWFPALAGLGAAFYAVSAADGVRRVRRALASGADAHRG